MNSGAGTTKMKIDIPSYKRKVGKNRFFVTSDSFEFIGKKLV